MVISGIMIRMNLTDLFSQLLAPFIKPIFRIRSTCIYVIFVGFLCGFPMGAHVTAQLYERKQLTKNEAEYLLSFCNNIGPVYFVSFARKYFPSLRGRKPEAIQFLPTLNGRKFTNPNWTKTVFYWTQISKISPRT